MTKQKRPIYSGIHMVESTPDSWALEPERFQKGDMRPHMHSQFVWVLLKDEEETPIFFSFSFTQSGMNWCTIHRLGKTPFEKQSRLVELPLYDAKKERKCTYKKVDGDPAWMTLDETTYEIMARDPDFWVQLNSRGMRITGAGMNLFVKYLPLGAFFGGDCPMGAPYLVHFAECYGTYRGKPLAGMGGTEKCMAYPDSTGEYQSMIVMDLAGKRQDGRCESCIVYVYSDNRAMAFYHLEGEAPVSALQVKFCGAFRPLAYAGDETLVLVQADCCFGGKKIHYQAEYGFRGGGDPLDETEGFSNTAGSWYEGEAFYPHTQEFATTELHRITRSVLNTQFSIRDL